MSFTGSENHEIDLSTASEWTANFRNSLNSSSDPTIAHYFSKSYIQSILEQDECVGIRVYHALDENGKRQLIICGVKSDESDIENGILADDSKTSPPSGKPGALNT